jgi:phosphoglucomutase
MSTIAKPKEKALLAKLWPADVKQSQLAGEPVIAKLARAPGNVQPIGGSKVATAHGWFAVRPAGMDNICKLYAESSRNDTHLNAIVEEAREIVRTPLAQAGQR